MHAPLETTVDSFRCGAQPNHQIAGAHRGTVAGIEHSAAARANDQMLLGADVRDDALLKVAEVRFALVAEDVRNPLLLLPFDFGIGIDEPPAQSAREDSADRGLASAR